MIQESSSYVGVPEEAARASVRCLLVFGRSTVMFHCFALDRAWHLHSTPPLSAHAQLYPRKMVRDMRLCALSDVSNTWG